MSGIALFFIVETIIFGALAIYLNTPAGKKWLKNL